EIQRCFQLIDFFWNLKYDNQAYEPSPQLCIALSIALVYYFRLPTKTDREERNDKDSPTREELSEILSRTFLSNFDEMIQSELEKFVTNDNFLIPSGVGRLFVYHMISDMEVGR
ncbi:unnamed protein product, partial [Didymodactylos carnosus]